MYFDIFSALWMLVVWYLGALLIACDWDISSKYLALGSAFFLAEFGPGIGKLLMRLLEESVTEDEVAMTTRSGYWMNARKIRKEINRRRGLWIPLTVSRQQLWTHLSNLIDRGVVERQVRELSTIPPFPPFISALEVIWEYRRVI